MGEWLEHRAGVLLEGKGIVERRAHFDPSGGLMLIEWERASDGYWKDLWIGRAGLGSEAAEKLRSELNRRAERAAREEAGR